MTDPADYSIPIFPLATVVLFPTVSVPLFIFEPRYRRLVGDALAGSRRIGMVAVRREHQDQMQGDPPVFDTGCEGAISQAEERPDGTWNLLLTATTRFRIVREWPRNDDRLYRIAQVVALEDTTTDSERFHALRREIHEQLDDLLRPALDPAVLPNALATIRGLDDQRFANTLAQMLDFDVLEKQRLLEASGQLDRAATLRDLLDFRLAEARVPGATVTSRIQ
jgi:Lon protease-like protein